METSMSKSSNKINMDRICSLLGVDSLSDFDEKLMLNDSGVYGYAYDEAIGEGKSEEEAQQAGMDAEAEEAGEASDKYYDAVMSVAEDLMSKHDLSLEPVKVKGKEVDRPWEYRVVPASGKTWSDALTCIRLTINGVGFFHFDSNQQLADSIPCSIREAVLTHLHRIKDWWDVYESVSNLQRLVDRRMR